MTRLEVSAQVARRTKVGLQKVDDILLALFDVIRNAMESGDEVYLRGFGTFKTFKAKATVGRVVRTGETIKIPEQMRVKFVPSKKLKDVVKQVG